MNDELQLIADCKQQKRQAQKALYDTYARKMFGICLRYTGDEDAAKDLLQEGFIKVFANIATFEGRGSFEGWMKRIFINLALENIRRNKTIIQTSDNIENLSDEANIITDTEEMETIPLNVLLSMVQELPKGYAAVFNLYAIEDYSHKEIAELLNINEGTSRSQYIRARRILQDKVNKYLTDLN